MAYDNPNIPSITGWCDGPIPSVNRPVAPMAADTEAARLAMSTGWHVYVCSTAVPNSTIEVLRAAMAMGTSGSPRTALGYQRALNPSASARSACWTILSTLAVPPVNPMRMGGRYCYR